MNDATADLHLPKCSQALPASPSLSKVLNLSSPINHFAPSDPQREQWVSKNPPSSIQLKLNTPFGKENLNQCFMLEPSLFHTLLPVYHSGFLSVPIRRTLFHTCSTSRTFCQLMNKYTNLNFRPLCDSITTWSPQVKSDRSDMITAALLHYNSNVATLVRFIGGVHVSAHRDIPSTINQLRGIVASDVHLTSNGSSHSAARVT
jgi:hypothetical protein